MRFSIRAILLFVVVAACVLVIYRRYLDSLPLEYEPYTPARLTSALNKGRCVMVSFYADWDINTIHTIRWLPHNVTREIRNHHIVALEADWTHNSPVVSKLLADLGMNTVPLIVFYNPKTPDAPILLPDGQTESSVLQAIEACCK